MDAETVVETVQQSAASEVAAETVAAVESSAAVVATEVVAVEAQLAAHQAQSEERHEEIIEGEEWLSDELSAVRTDLTATRESLLQLREAQTTMLERTAEILNLLLAMEARNNPPSLPDSRQSSPTTLEPEISPAQSPSDVEGQREAETPAQPRPKKRRIV